MRKIHIAVAMVIFCLAMTISCLAEYDRSVIRQVQEMLNAAGYDCGTPDGIAGRRTAAGVTNYQKDHQLTADGQINDELLISLGIMENESKTEYDIGFFGAVNSNTYRNDYFGFEFQANEEWYFFSDVDVAQINGITSSVVTEEDFESQLEEMEFVTVCSAMKNNGSGENISIIIQTDDLFYGNDLDMMMLYAKPGLEQGLIDAGYSNLTIENTNIVFAGEIRPSYAIEGTILGQKIYEQEIVLYKEPYLAFITITTGEKKNDQILSLFRPIVSESSTDTDTSTEIVDDSIDWKDSNLEAAMKTALGITDRDITYNDIKDVTELDLSDKKISDISALSAMKKLVNLNLGLNNISDISALAGMTNLKELDLFFNRISNVSALADLTNLQYLILSGNKISDIRSLSRLTNLQVLDISYNNISDISPLSEMTQLRELTMLDTLVTDTSPVDHLVKNGLKLYWLQLFQ